MFKENTFKPLDKKGFNFTKEHTPTNSNSTWAITHFPESAPFKAELAYKNTSNPDNNYQLRIGKGGQIYSFIGSFGESVPPQYRAPNEKYTDLPAGKDYAPWVDEVWQMVCVNMEKNDPSAHEKYFIHQAGVYLNTPEQTTPFYSPIVAEYYDADHQSYTIVNWGQQAHSADNLNRGFTSSLLYYTRYTNMGEGVIQVDYLVYNFGEDEIDHYNAPWGGVRTSSLDQFFMSNPDNTYTPLAGAYGKTDPIRMSKTAGWMAWSADALGKEASLGIVLNQKSVGRSNLFRYGQAGRKGGERDYYVFTTSKKPHAGQLSFGKSLSRRYYFVLNASVDAVKATITKQKLAKHAFDAAGIPAKSEVADLSYQFKIQENRVVATMAKGTNTHLKAKARPYANSYPIFLITAADGRQQITSNLYYFSKLAYDGQTAKIDLLGFLDSPTSISLINDQFCAGDNYILPDGTDIKKPKEGPLYFSNNDGIQSLINLKIDNTLTCNELIIPTVLATNLKEEITFRPAVYRPTISVDLKSKHKQIDLQLLDSHGKIITSKKLKNTQIFDVDLPISRGHYTLKLVLCKDEFATIDLEVKGL